MSRDRVSSVALASRRPAFGRAVLLAAIVGVVVLLALPVGLVLDRSAAAPTVAPVGPHSLAPALATAPAARSPGVHQTPAPGAGVFNPPCYPIDIGVCVSIQSPTETNIIPAVGTFVSSVQPNATSDLPLIIKSRNQLNWPSAAHYGQKSPINLNVSANLWNGDPYYSIQQGDYWHASNPQNVWNGPTLVSSNTSGYIYWYNVSISAKASNGVRNFYPGETVTWWIELTYNVSNVYIHHEGPHFVFTYSGAWPYSPYPGSNQYAGASATFQDIQLTVNPASPNWNDSVHLILNTTQADVLSNATIGSAYVDLSEVAPNGNPVQSGTLVFPTSVNSAGFGVTSTNVTVPASYAQLPGATVTYIVTVFDAANDQLVTPPATWLVGANGSFLSGIFVDDLGLASNPSSVTAEPVGLAMLNPGQQLNVTLTSRNPGTAISAAEIVAQVSFPILHETVTLTRPMARESSTIFVGSIQGMPIGAFVNYTVLAWDFTQRLEISPGFGYYTPDFQTFDPVLDNNASFFYVLVYDNGSHNWVNGVKVQVQGPASTFNSVGNTTLGLSYPNQTRNVYLPLLLAANASYKVTITDAAFVPAVGTPGAPITVTVLGVHSMTTRQTLAQGPDYTVVQAGDQILFWLNTTPAAPTPSPSVPGGTAPIAGVVGLAGVAIAAYPLGRWWQQIRQRRKEEEKRVTL